MAGARSMRQRTRLLDGVEADRAQRQRLLDRGGHLGQLEGLHKAQDLHVLALAMLAHARLHQTAQGGEDIGQVPALQGRGLVQGVDLAFDQREVMQGVEADVFPLVAAGMAGYDLAAAADHELAHIAADPDLLVAEGDRNGIVVGLVAHQGLRRDLSAGLVARFERGGWKLTHGHQVPLQPLADRLALAAQPVALAQAGTALPGRR